MKGPTGRASRAFNQITQPNWGESPALRIWGESRRGVRAVGRQTTVDDVAQRGIVVIARLSDHRILTSLSLRDVERVAVAGLANNGSCVRRGSLLQDPGSVAVARLLDTGALTLTA